eukprot:CAMPEP_0114503626 /NCGR_PEP_ID=MMETSP0109-20121206/9751_1 /TAXON_ID=29199 /ORGANISM="Chlorarachnion reptans, Strain CCCM449" /LENGTH=178 /DNA_ID=CAMNT_0001681673 /DNA_START=204 /DNA_END=740 /DNA_ORIENTATION=+
MAVKRTTALLLLLACGTAANARVAHRARTRIGARTGTARCVASPNPSFSSSSSSSFAPAFASVTPSALPLRPGVALLRMRAADDDDEVAGEGFGRRGPRRRKKKQERNDDRAMTPEEVMAANPKFYDYEREDEFQGPLWKAIGWGLENAVAIFVFLLVTIGGAAAYLFQIKGGMEVGL